MECHLKNWSPKRKKIVYAAHWQGVPVSRCAQKNKDWSGKVKIMNVFKTGSFDWVTASKKRDVCPTTPTWTALKLRSKVRKTSRVELDILSFFISMALFKLLCSWAPAFEWKIVVVILTGKSKGLLWGVRGNNICRSLKTELPLSYLLTTGRGIGCFKNMYLCFFSIAESTLLWDCVELQCSQR